MSFQRLPVPGPFPPIVTSNDVRDIRPFSTESIQDAVNNALANTILPSGVKGAVVAHVTLDGAKLSVVANINKKWSVVAEGFKPYYGKLEAGAKVVFHW